MEMKKMARGIKRKYLSESYGEGVELEEQQRAAEMFVQEEDMVQPQPVEQAAPTPPRIDMLPLNRPTERPMESVTANNLNKFGQGMQMDRNFILRQMYAVLPSPDILALMDDGA